MNGLFSVASPKGNGMAAKSSIHERLRAAELAEIKRIRAHYEEIRDQIRADGTPDEFARLDELEAAELLGVTEKYEALRGQR